MDDTTTPAHRRSAAIARCEAARDAAAETEEQARRRRIAAQVALTGLRETRGLDHARRVVAAYDGAAEVIIAAALALIDDTTGEDTTDA